VKSFGGSLPGLMVGPAVGEACAEGFEVNAFQVVEGSRHRRGAKRCS
jgi:hypothetical protein